MKANFEKAWDKFDINQDGFIKAEETHTFMRSLMGKLNKFALAPGSLSDIGMATDVKMSTPKSVVEKKAEIKKAAPAPKKEVKVQEDEDTPSDTADAALNQELDALADNALLGSPEME